MFGAPFLFLLSDFLFYGAVRPRISLPFRALHVVVCIGEDRVRRLVEDLAARASARACLKHLRFNSESPPGQWTPSAGDWLAGSVAQSERLFLKQLARVPHIRDASTPAEYILMNTSCPLVETPIWLTPTCGELRFRDRICREPDGTGMCVNARATSSRCQFSARRGHRYC